METQSGTDGMESGCARTRQAIKEAGKREEGRKDEKRREYQQQSKRERKSS